MVLLGVGGVEGTPDFEGLAIGDLLLHNYSALKYDAYYRDNGNDEGRPNDAHRYPDSELESGTRHEYAPFLSWLNSQEPKENASFSSTRSPSTKARFGAYAPMPNGMMYKPDYELVFIKDGSGSDAKTLARDRRRKVMRGFSKGDGATNSGRFPRMAGIIDNGKNDGIVRYRVKGERYQLDDHDYGEDGDNIEDVINELDTLRIEIDDNIAEGELYLLGEVFGTCIQRPLEVWRRRSENYDYRFRIDADRSDPSRESRGTGGVHSQPDGYEDANRHPKYPYRSGNEAVLTEAGAPWFRSVPQRAAIASFTTNRPCDVVEIGLKSIVYRQITGFTNLNSLPNEERIEEFEQDKDDQSQITPGRMSKYTSRWSFFQLYGRILNGASNDWQRLTDTENEAFEAFAVYNNNPSELYNTIQIKQNGKDLYEYELRPVPGNLMIKRVVDGNKEVVIYLLTGNALDIDDPNRANTFSIPGRPNADGLTVSYTGKRETLTAEKLMNPEWIRGKPYIEYETISDIKPDKTGNIPYPVGPTWNLVDDSRWSPEDNTRPRTGCVVRSNGTIEVWREGQKQGEDDRPNDPRVKAIWNDGIEYRYKPAYNTFGDPSSGIDYKKTAIPDEITKVTNDTEWSIDFQNKQYGGLFVSGAFGVLNINGYRYWYYNGFLVDGTTTPTSQNEVITSNGENKYVISDKRSNGGLKEESVSDWKYDYRDYFVNKDKNKYVWAGNVVTNSEFVKYEAGNVVKNSDRTETQYKYIEDKFYVKWGEKGNSRFRSCIKQRTDGSGLYDFYWQGTLIVSGDRNLNAEYNGYRYDRDERDPEQRIGDKDSAGKVTHNVWRIFKKEIIPAESAKYEIRRKKYYRAYDGWEIEKYTIKKGRDGQAPISIEQKNPGADQRLDPDGVVEVEMTGGSGSGAKVSVNVWNNFTYREWTLIDGGQDYEKGDTLTIPGAGLDNTVEVTSTVTEQRIITDDENSNDFDDGYNFFPYNAACDYILYSAERMSNESEPEHEITFINEIYRDVNLPYKDMVVGGLRLNSSKEWTTFQNLSYYFQTGLSVAKLTTSGTGATNNFPEIAYALLTDPRFAGQFIGERNVDKESMTVAAKFCAANGFTWDGVIAERLNIRDFLFTMGAYNMLDFRIKGGQFSLYPSVPFKSNFEIDAEKDMRNDVKALFTDGNVRNLKATFLSPEERQSFRAVCTYRKETKNGFPSTEAVLVGRNLDTSIEPIERFDMTQFCTSKDHAVKFASYAIRTRETIDHGITFETTPQAAMGLEPGEIFRFASRATHLRTSENGRLQNGAVDADGYIVAGSDFGPNASVSVYYWKVNTENTPRAGVITTDENGKVTDPIYYNTVFSAAERLATDRMYKVETMSYADSGLVEVSASYYPVKADDESYNPEVLDFRGIENQRVTE